MNCVQYLNVSSALLVLTASIFLLFEEGSWFSSVVEPTGSADGVAGDRSIISVVVALSLPEEPLVQSDTPPPLLTCNNETLFINQKSCGIQLPVYFHPTQGDILA